ncbi:hypothetical protein QLH51_18660 [Sphingomonas sp. 2R-10]|uniref:hypothetical protein n=1 Tax=Sphingomonas sp. 2R-10 TaxID=3045148 RepID=UPI000F772051|nr:hypothetical protein [Sphingomonas sp. 2R-10]MDJ0278818.1 hypothetical protein [Sphingomonas sp. 2R-10]
MIRPASLPPECSFGRSPRVFDGNIRTKATGTVIFFCKEITVKNPTAPFQTAIPHDPVDRLDALIAAARADMAAAEAEAAKAEADIAAIEPHPHAHGYTAGGDCRYAGFQPGHRLALAGLLARPWRFTLERLEVAKLRENLDYLLKAFPSVLDDGGIGLAEEGATALTKRGEVVADAFAHKPTLGIGMVWRAYGFHHRDCIAWVGAFAYRGGLSLLVDRTAGVDRDTPLGDVLTATVKTHARLLTPIGEQELHARAARRDACRQASWSSVPEAYRENGPWRDRAPTKGQRHIMRQIEAARGLPMIEIGRRGDSSEWIADAGGNPRFRQSNEEQR